MTTTGATLPVLFSSAIILIPSLVSSCCTRLGHSNKLNERDHFLPILFFYLGSSFRRKLGVSCYGMP